MLIISMLIITIVKEKKRMEMMIVTFIKKKEGI